MRVERVKAEAKVALKIEIVSAFVDQRIVRAAKECVFEQFLGRVHDGLTLASNSHGGQFVQLEVSILGPICLNLFPQLIGPKIAAIFWPKI